MTDTAPAPDTSAPASDPAGVGGTVAPPSPPQEPAKPTPAQKRAATLRAKAEAAEKRARAREARRAAQPAAEPAAEEEAAPIASELDDRTLRENIAAGLEVVWLLVCLVAGLFGRRMRPYTDAEREADAKAWLPLAKRWAWVGSMAGWVGAPVRLIQRVREKLEPKAKVAG